MSDNIKLIIEISKEDYDFIKIHGNPRMHGFKAIQNGIPLDDVKAEIQASMYCDKDTRLVENANASGLKEALRIIDNIGKKESQKLTDAVGLLNQSLEDVIDCS